MKTKNNVEHVIFCNLLCNKFKFMDMLLVAPFKQKLIELSASYWQQNYYIFEIKCDFYDQCRLKCTQNFISYIL